MTGKTKAQKPAKLTVENVKAVIQANSRKRKLGGFELENHVYEQIFWRRFMVIQKSPECWETGACKVCGCDILGKTMEDRACEDDTPCYPEMMDEATWAVYKHNNDIKLFQ